MRFVYGTNWQALRAVRPPPLAIQRSIAAPSPICQLEALVRADHWAGGSTTRAPPPPLLPPSIGMASVCVSDLALRLKGGVAVVAAVAATL